MTDLLVKVGLHLEDAPSWWFTYMAGGRRPQFLFTWTPPESCSLPFRTHSSGESKKEAMLPFKAYCHFWDILYNVGDNYTKAWIPGSRDNWGLLGAWLLHMFIADRVCVCVCVCVFSHFSHVQLFVTLWTVACQPPLSMGFSRWEHWSRLPCPPPGDLPNPGIELA